MDNTKLTQANNLNLQIADLRRLHTAIGEGRTRLLLHNYQRQYIPSTVMLDLQAMTSQLYLSIGEEIRKKEIEFAEL